MRHVRGLSRWQRSGGWILNDSKATRSGPHSRVHRKSIVIAYLLGFPFPSLPTNKSNPKALWRTKLKLMSPCSIFIFFFLLCAVASTVSAQSLPPARADGFVYNRHERVEPDTVMIEAFLDPVCPDSRDSWDPLKQALHHYAHRVFLLVHLLPLPYHDNAFVASRALHVVHELNASATFDMLEWFFDNQEKFYNARTFNMSRTDVVKLIVKSVTEVIGDSYYSKVESDFKNRKTDLKTRVSFKYSASRGVFGTPAFFINGFALSGTGSAITYKGWRDYIDPLISEQGIRSDETVRYFL